MPRSEVCARACVCEREMSAVYDRGVKVQNCKVISHGDILSQQCDWKRASMETSCWAFFFACEKPATRQFQLSSSPCVRSQRLS